MAKRVSVVISQGQSQSPAKRALEEDLVAALLLEPGLDVIVIPHLYDLQSGGTGVLALQGVSGDLIVLSWLYGRAARWVLDRHGVHGQKGKSKLDAPREPDDDDAEPANAASHHDTGDDALDDKERVIARRPTPPRKIYCLDLRCHDAAAPFVEEVKRVAAECRVQVVELMNWIGGAPQPEQLRRYLQPTNDTALPAAAPSEQANGHVHGNGHAPIHFLATGNGHGAAAAPAAAAESLKRVVEEGPRRWYPVIDYSRCTNCMECVDFCLFGVYGVDKLDTILVEQPDNCRKGCPACSRVCPENAIMFPQHKTPGIAGALEAAASLKIDLSQLFGAPDALDVAARERDEQLLLAGRNVVGSAGMPKRQANKDAAPKDDLDNLLDQLDDLDL